MVEINDESEAASIFESINDRKKPLSTLDKTRSFLMYMDERSSQSGTLETLVKQRFGSIYRNLFVLSTGYERVNDFGLALAEVEFDCLFWVDGFESVVHG